MTSYTDHTLLALLKAIKSKYIGPEEFWKRYAEEDSDLHLITVNLEIFASLLSDPTPLEAADYCTIDSGQLEKVMNALFPERIYRLTGREIVAHSPAVLGDRGVLIFGASDQSRHRAILRYQALGAKKADVYTFEEPEDFWLDHDNAPRRWAGFFAYGHPKQEEKITAFRRLYPDQPLIALGIGGAVDYFSGMVATPPAIFHKLGFEWLWRLIIQPKTRAFRIFSIIPLSLQLRRLARQKNSGKFQGGRLSSPIRPGEKLYLIGGDGMAGGVETFNIRLSTHLRQAGLEVAEIPLNSYLRRGRPILLVWRWLVAIIIAMTRVFFGRPDHILVSCANFLDVLAVRAIVVISGRRNIAVVAHFNQSWSFWDTARYRKIFRHTSRKTRLFAIAPSQKRFFQEQGLTVEKEIFPNFFNYRPLTPPVRSDYMEGRALRALYVGRIVPEKCVLEVTRYLSRLAAKDFPIELRLVGPAAKDIESALLQVNSPGLTIILLGTLSPGAVSREMGEADLFISFSGSDTLPLTYLEAAAHGLGVVTLENDATRDVQALTGTVAFANPDGPIEQERSLLRRQVQRHGQSNLAALIPKNDQVVIDLVRNIS